MSDYKIIMKDGTVLCHYGVKGMKWGVIRKLQAISAGRDYARANKKQAKIQNKMDRWNTKYANKEMKAGSKLDKKAIKDEEKIIKANDKINARIDKLTNEKYAGIRQEELDLGYAQYKYIKSVAIGAAALSAYELYTKMRG